MIPVTAFVSLILFMIPCVAFGWLLGKLTMHHEEDTPVEQERHACDTCKFEYTKPTEEPCLSCLEDDVDMWEKDE